MESILLSIKKLLGVEESYIHFDQDIIMHINSVLMILNQLGVGPEDGFVIHGYSETWRDFVTNDTLAESIKSYVYLKVRKEFDPPTIGTVSESMNSMISELEWRINVAVENGRL